MKWIVTGASLIILGAVFLCLDTELGKREYTKGILSEKRYRPESITPITGANGNTTYSVTPEEHRLEFDSYGSLRVSGFEYAKTVIGREYLLILRIGYWTSNRYLVGYSEIPNVER